MSVIGYGGPLLYGSAGSDVLEGGDGDDVLYADRGYQLGDQLILNGGKGDDWILTGGAGKATIDAGSGDDRITVDISRGEIAVRMGDGADILELLASVPVGAASITVRDFQSIDQVDLEAYLGSEALLGYVAGEDPFAAGFLRLKAASGGGWVLQVDRNSNGEGWQTLVLFKGEARLRRILSVGTRPIPP